MLFGNHPFETDFGILKIILGIFFLKLIRGVNFEFS